MSAEDALNGVKILIQLVKLGRLTKYQAAILAGQSRGPLRRGEWIIRGPVPNPIWSEWLEIAPLHPNADSSDSNRWARWLTPADLMGLRTAVPDLARLTQLAELRDVHLQSVDEPHIDDQELLVRVSPVQAPRLTEVFASSPASPETALTIVEQVLCGLAELHQHGLSHGRILPDRITWDGTRATLLLDPLCSVTATLDAKTVGLLGEQLGHLSVLHFVAPEFIAPGQLPNEATDVYALGCTWWWLMTGEPLIQGESPEQMLAAHAAHRNCIPERFELNPIWQRVLSHSLAPNSESRFTSAVPWLKATHIAQQMIVEKTVPPSKQTKLKKSSAAQRALHEEKPILPPKQAGAASQRPTRHDATKQDATKQVAAPQDAANKDAAAARVPQTSNPQQSAHTPPTRRRKRSNNRWMLPVFGGTGFLILLLLVLKFSGALNTSTKNQRGAAPPAYVPPAQSQPSTPPPADPRSEYFSVVEASDGALWLPPLAPSPIQIDLLPAGAGCFLAIRPADLFASQEKLQLAKNLDPAISEYLQTLAASLEQPLENITSLVLALYPPTIEGDFPELAYRVELRSAAPLNRLKQAWKVGSSDGSEGRALLVSGDTAYYTKTPAEDSGSPQTSDADSSPESNDSPVAANSPANLGQELIRTFSFGPTYLMQSVAEISGNAAPLVSPMEKLWQASASQSDLVVLASAPFLFTDGRGLIQRSPPRLETLIRELLGSTARAALVHMNLESNWYLELQIVGTNSPDAGRITDLLRSRISGLPEQVEQWFVEQSPHPYWRALAFRYPQMLRALSKYTRYGIEDDVAIANAYLPAVAAPNLLLTSWIALQDGSTIAGPLAPGQVSTTTTATLSIDEYLARPIRLSFVQEPIEEALRMIGEEANDDLPSGAPVIQFQLDGGAFESAGITRNQQLRDFSIENEPVRNALTELAKRGNPVTSVTDTRQSDQKLIWVVRDGPGGSSNPVISLTTRDAAAKAGISLPVEFAPNP